MNRFGKCLLLFCVMATLLAGTASANSAPPDYLVAVKLENRPDELYYLDILAEGSGGTDGLIYSYSEDEIAGMDASLLEKLRGAVPEGWFPCTLGSYRDFQVKGDLIGVDGVHHFRGFDVPQKFRVLVVTQSGESWVSDVLSREAMQMGVRVDWAAKSALIPPVWGAYALQFLSTLLPTLVFEGLVLLLFGYEWRKNWKPFLLTNLVTQGALAAFLCRYVVRSGLGHYSAIIFCVILIPAELVILLVEAGVYREFLSGHSKGRAVGYAVAANLVSYFAGWFVVQAVWENVTKVFWLGV